MQIGSTRTTFFFFGLYHVHTETVAPADRQDDSKEREQTRLPETPQRSHWSGTAGIGG